MLEMTAQVLFLGSPLLPVAIAQGLCIKYDWLSRLRQPLDFGKSFQGKRIFGDHKTWRGLIVNVVFCVMGVTVQTWLQAKGYLPSWLFLLDYVNHTFLAGILLGLGMTAGELPNSFLKRRFEIPPGESREGLLGVLFFVYDQVDLTIGIWVFLYVLIKPSLWLILWSLLLTLALHLSVSIVGYVLGMRKTLV